MNEHAFTHNRPAVVTSSSSDRPSFAAKRKALFMKLVKSYNLNKVLGVPQVAFSTLAFDPTRELIWLFDASSSLIKIQMSNDACSMLHIDGYETYACKSVDTDGKVYATDYLTMSVVIFESGRILKRITMDMKPVSLICDSAGSFYVLGTKGNRFFVKRYSDHNHEDWQWDTQQEEQLSNLYFPRAVVMVEEAVYVVISSPNTVNISQLSRSGELVRRISLANSDLIDCLSGEHIDRERKLIATHLSVVQISRTSMDDSIVMLVSSGLINDYHFISCNISMGFELDKLGKLASMSSDVQALSSSRIAVGECSLMRKDAYVKIYSL